MSNDVDLLRWTDFLDHSPEVMDVPLSIVEVTHHWRYAFIKLIVWVHDQN